MKYKHIYCFIQAIKLSFLLFAVWSHPASIEIPFAHSFFSAYMRAIRMSMS